MKRSLGNDFFDDETRKDIDKHLEEQIQRVTPHTKPASKRQRTTAYALALAPPNTTHTSVSQLPFSRLELCLNQSPHFWYPDGNIILRVERTYFKLYHTRLAQYCECFPKQLAPVPESKEERETFEGCPVFTISTLTVKDFHVFLTYMESPVQLLVTRLSQADAASILRAAHVLKSPLFTGIAIRALEAIWPSQYSADLRTRRPCADAIVAITLAHDYHIPQLLKRAFFVVLRSRTFWDTLKHDRAHIALTEAELLSLHDARCALGSAWRQLVLTPPGVDCCAPEHAVATGMACKVRGKARAGEWCAFWIERGLVEQGARDPWQAVDALKAASVDLRAAWCWWCLEERACAWDAALQDWWERLDEWLGLKRAQ